MRDLENVEALAELKPDFMGMIFYEKSKRYLDHIIPAHLTNDLKRVGVFVNTNKAEILEKVNTQQLDYVQLHGKESPAFCAALKVEGVHLIKAFSVDENFDFDLTKVYEPYCDYFLFDTKGKNPGGNGIVFDWEILRKYKGNTPFLLAGGIGEQHLTEVQKLQHPMLAGVDLNSGFETAPGLKNIDTLKTFIHELRH